MNKESKTIVAGIVAVAVLVVAYYGNYLPLRKSQSFIYATRVLASGKIQTLEQFRNVLEVPLNLESPVGHEEIVRNTANILLNQIRSTAPTPDQQKVMTNFVLDIAKTYFDPLLARGKGMSFQQNLYIMGLLHQISYIQTKDMNYLVEAEKYYRTAHEAAPKRPQPLYGLFDVYRLMGNEAKVKEVSDNLLSLWPEDQNIKKGIEEFENNLKKTKGQTKAK